MKYWIQLTSFKFCWRIREKRSVSWWFFSPLWIRAESSYYKSGRLKMQLLPLVICQLLINLNGLPLSPGFHLQTIDWKSATGWRFVERKRRGKKKREDNQRKLGWKRMWFVFFPQDLHLCFHTWAYDLRKTCGKIKFLKWKVSPLIKESS